MSHPAPRILRAFAISLLAVLPQLLLSGPSEQTRVLDAAGGWSSNNSHIAVSAVAQPMPVGEGEAGGRRNRSGFLHAFLLMETDTDGDGAPDEDDADDDNDRISDGDELSGASFEPRTTTDPMASDSDGDGADDGSEAVAGTDPTDSNKVLRITGLERAGPDVTVRWQARDGYSYEGRGARAPGDIKSTPLLVTNITATGGSGVWEEVEGSWTHRTGETGLFYRISTGGK